MAENAPESTQTDEIQPAAVGTPDTTENGDEDELGQADSFPRAYVERLRKEAAANRDKAKTAEDRVTELTGKLLTHAVAATGRLADPTDLQLHPEVDGYLLDEPDTLSEIIEALLQEKPHLAARKPVGDIGQGERGTSAERFSLLGHLKGRV